jgi:Lon-like ATP-dependent protease
MPGQGSLTVTGIVEEEELNSRSGRLRRQSTARASVDNVMTAMNRIIGCNTADYDLHINFPGGTPVDGPSAGAALLAAVYSALTGAHLPARAAMTGEVTIKGRVNPVGGVAAKLEAAAEAGVETVYIPKANFHKAFEHYPLRVVCVETVEELITGLFGERATKNSAASGRVAAL